MSDKAINPQTMAIVVGVGAAALLVAYVGRKGIGGAAAAAASGVVSAAGGVVAGTASAIGEPFGLPTTEQTTRDPAVARWVIDHYGHWEASKWAGAGALAQALFMSEGEGRPPPPSSPLGVAIRRGELGAPRDIDVGGNDNGAGWG